MKILALVLITCSLAAAQAKPEAFDVDGHKAYLQVAPTPAKGKPWIWYAPNVKGDFIILKHKMYADAFLNAGLAKNKVPMFSVHGDKDGTVPYDENTKLLKERYETLDGTCEVKIIPGRGHEVSPAFFQCQELVDFILKHAVQ